MTPQSEKCSGCGKIRQRTSRRPTPCDWCGGAWEPYIMVAWRNTERGFRFGKFSDRYGAECEIQKSSLATEDAIWLGLAKPDLKTGGHAGVPWADYQLPPRVTLASARMHLTREQVRQLLPVLQHFVRTGELP